MFKNHSPAIFKNSRSVLRFLISTTLFPTSHFSNKIFKILSIFSGSTSLLPTQLFFILLESNVFSPKKLPKPLLQGYQWPFYPHRAQFSLLILISLSVPLNSWPLLSSLTFQFTTWFCYCLRGHFTDPRSLHGFFKITHILTHVSPLWRVFL